MKQGISAKVSPELKQKLLDHCKNNNLTINKYIINLIEHDLKELRSQGYSLTRIIDLEIETQVLRADRDLYEKEAKAHQNALTQEIRISDEFRTKLTQYEDNYTKGFWKALKHLIKYYFG